MQDAKGVGALLLNGDLSVGDVGPAGKVGGPSLAGCTQSENSEPGRHHDGLDAGDYAVPNATYAPAMPVVKLAEGFREGEGFLRHDAYK